MRCRPLISCLERVCQHPAPKTQHPRAVRAIRHILDWRKRRMPLEINQKEVAPGTSVISLAGNVMRGPEGERIEAVLNGLLGQGRRRIIFDLTGVKRIDSTGIGRFIYGLNKVEESGGKMWMAGAQGYVRECFRVTRLDTIFQFCETVEDALAANERG